MDHGAGSWSRDEVAWFPLPSLGRRFAHTLLKHPLRASSPKARVRIWTDLAASFQGSDSQLELEEAIVFCIRPRGGGALVGSLYNLDGFKPGLRQKTYQSSEHWQRRLTEPEASGAAHNTASLVG